MTIGHECGIVGVASPDAATRAIMALQAVQHRGQESAGAASFDGALHVHKGMGLVEAVFAVEPELPGNMAVAHNRYSTCGSSSEVNAGPFVEMSELGPFAVAHNGNVVNGPELRALVASHGLSPQSTSDSEVLAMLLRLAPGSGWADRMVWVASKVIGSYSLAILTGDGVIGVRDPLGNRPLSLGTWTGAEGATGWILASESCAFAMVGATLTRDVAPGEMIQIRPSGVTSLGRLPASRHAFCAFEYIYIARPDSVIGGRTVHEVRQAIGRRLAEEHPADADLVMGVPDSGTSAALGFATGSGIPFGEGLIKNRYVARTFIQPHQADRERLIRMKFGVLPMHGRRIVLVDDSIVRGNTLRPIVALLRDAGAAEIHVRIASPRIFDPCYLGVDMATRDELIANHCGEADMAGRFRADSLHHVSVDGLLEAVRGSSSTMCLACFTGQYPLRLESERTEQAAEPVTGAMQR